MPLTSKGIKILRAMREKYGDEKGTRVFYSSQNKGVITGTHEGGKKRKRGSRKLGLLLGARK